VAGFALEVALVWGFLPLRFNVGDATFLGRPLELLALVLDFWIFFFGEVSAEDLNVRGEFDLIDSETFATGDFDLERDFNTVDFDLGDFDTGDFDLERDFDTGDFDLGDFDTGDFDLERDFDTGDFDLERDFNGDDLDSEFFLTDDRRDIFFSIFISFFFVTNL